MAEVNGSIQGIIEMLETQMEQHRKTAKSADLRIKSGEYGPGWTYTKTDHQETKAYNQGAAWGCTRAIDLLGTLNALMYHELNKSRLPENCCTTCGAEQDPRPQYCETQECNTRAKFRVVDEAGTEMLSCMSHLDLTLNALGPSKVESI